MDATKETFERDVIERSHEVPVVVDFGADWCGPCKMLTPVLKREAEARAGELDLFEVDVDANRELAERYQVQGIPAVKAFRRGEVVDEFVGALPPAAVAEFLDRLTGPSGAEKLIAELRDSGELPEALVALEAEDYERALQILIDEIIAAEGERRERLLGLTLGLFRDLGDEHPQTMRYRRELAARLY